MGQHKIQRINSEQLKLKQINLKAFLLRFHKLHLGKFPANQGPILFLFTKKSKKFVTYL